MFFLALNCINKTIKVTDDNCRMIQKIIKIKLDAHPGIEESVKNFKYNTKRTDIKQTKTPNKEIFKILTDNESK